MGLPTISKSIGQRNEERIAKLEKKQKKPAAKPEPVDRNFQTRSAYGKKQQPRKSIMGSQISREPDITNEM